MSAGYHLKSSALDPSAHTVHLEFAVRNQTGEPWRTAEGFAISYHVFEVETGTLIADGPRIHPEREIAPGESLVVGLDVPIPQEDGRYQVLVSPMREDVCWYYEQGWPFLLVEASTTSGASRIERTRVADSATLSRER